MLVLSSRQNECIVIDGDITVTVLEIRDGGKVRIGIDAPKEIPIHRGEVQQRIDGTTLKTDGPELDREGFELTA